MDAEQIKEAISALFGDTSVSPEETLDRLTDIHDHILPLIESVESDIRDAEAEQTDPDAEGEEP
jgi:hypothetical protein